MRNKSWFDNRNQNDKVDSWLLALLIIAALVLTHCTEPRASTYYIDFERGMDRHSGLSKQDAWKRCPGMKGFNGSYRHQAGDHFIFRGGSVWPAEALPLAIRHSGADSLPDVYATDHSWYLTSVWTQPTFTSHHTQTQLFTASKESNFIIDDLKFIDFGTAGIENGGKALDIQACSHYAIKHCTIAPQAWIGLYLHSYSGLSEEGILIDSNDISAAGQAIVLAVEAPHTEMQKVVIRNNSIHDLSSQIVGGTHGDGIHTWNSVQTDHSQFITDLSILDNHFFGDFSGGDDGKASMTALIYLTDPGKRATISGNALSYSKATHFTSLIWVRYFDSVSVTNNSLTMDTAQGGIGIIVGQGEIGKTVSLVGNTINGAKYCYYIYDDASPTIRIENNHCESTGPTVAFWNLAGKTWAEWQILGNDRHGSHTNFPPNNGLEAVAP